MATFTEPLHLFAIPGEVLEALHLRASPLANTSDPKTEDQTEGGAIAEIPSLQAEPANSTSCTLCAAAVFNNVQEQRSHFRSDWHRYNVKSRLQNPSFMPVTEAQFGNLLEGLEDSISGSESSSDGSQGSDEDDAVSALLQKTKLRDRSRSASPIHRGIPRSPINWFTSPQIQDTQFGIYSVVFPSDVPSSSYVEELKDMQFGGENGRLWAVFMTAGGHFAGAVIRVCQPDGGNDSNKRSAKNKHKPQPALEIVRHKTFHRYTTRRKQGGSQSVNDNAKGPAKSAGAQLRRYGEQALRDDIHALLIEWREDLDLCERIFIRANTANRRIFLDFDETPIPKGDDRLRTFPFPTRRPTQSEVLRCVGELTRVKISHLTEEALAAQDQALLDALPKPKPAAPVPPKPTEVRKPQIQKVSKEEEHQRELWSRLLDMVRKGRLQALKAFWEKQGQSLVGGVDGRLPDWLEGKDNGAGGTLLQVAAATGQHEIVAWLLEEQRADPTIPLPPSFSKAREETPDSEHSPAVAFDLALNQETRNAFRRCGYAHPDWWDWIGKARIRSVLTPEMEEKQKKEEAKRNKLREKAKEREAARLAAEAAAEEAAPAPAVPFKEASAPKDGPQRLGGAGASDKERQAVAGLTPEMRAKIERERRARAAEARLKGH